MGILGLNITRMSAARSIPTAVPSIDTKRRSVHTKILIQKQQDDNETVS